MGNKHSSPAPRSNDKPKAQHCEVPAEQLDRHGEGPDAVVAAVALKAMPGGMMPEHVFSLNVTLFCTQEDTRRERELRLKRIPETIADLQEEIQEQFNIPVFDQKLTLESLQSYSLRNGDNITVEYSSEADVEEIMGIVSYLQKTLAFFESVKSQLFPFPITTELDAQLHQNIDVEVLERFRAMCSIAAHQKRIINSLLFIKSGGLGHLQRLHSLLLQLPFEEMTLSVQVLEIGLNSLLWTLASCTETERTLLKELKWENIIQSLLRVKVVPNAAIMPPKNPHMILRGHVQIEVIVQLLTTTLGCLTWILEYDAPHIQHSLATNQTFLDQVLGVMQNKTVPFRRYLAAMNIIQDLAYNLDVHDHLCKPHVIQAIIRTWKNAEPTPENNATPAECVYLKYLAALLMSMLCITRQTFTSQYLQVADLMKSFLDEYNYREIRTHEAELGFMWSKYLPYIRVTCFPYDSRKSVLACGSDPRYRALQMMCVETCVLSLHVNMCEERERKMIAEQGLMDYVICLPSVLPAKSRAQQRAKDLVAMLGKEMHLQPPSLNAMARARLAVTHFGLDKVLKTPVQELLSEVYQPTP